jgi:hypothetical protein
VDHARFRRLVSDHATVMEVRHPPADAPGLVLPGQVGLFDE